MRVISDSIATDIELGSGTCCDTLLQHAFFRVLLALSLSLSLNLACVPLFLFLSLQLLVVSSIVYWECGCMCEGEPELVMEYPGGSVDTVHQIFCTILCFDHMSWSLSVSSLLRRDTLIVVLICVFDQKLNCSVCEVWSWLRLNFFCFVC